MRQIQYNRTVLFVVADAQKQYYRASQITDRIWIHTYTYMILLAWRYTGRNSGVDRKSRKKKIATKKTNIELAKFSCLA